MYERRRLRLSAHRKPTLVQAQHGRDAAGSYNPTKFSEVRAVASRNSLNRILAISVASGTCLRARSSSQAPLYVLDWAERERLLHRTSQNSYSTTFVHRDDVRGTPQNDVRNLCQ